MILEPMRLLERAITFVGTNLLKFKDDFAIAEGAFEALPTCNADWRGAQARVPGANGVADGYWRCTKNDSDTYEWVAVGAGGGAFGPEEAELVGNLPFLEIRSESDDSADRGILRLHREQDGGGSHPAGGANLGRIEMTALNSDSEVATGFWMNAETFDAPDADGVQTYFWMGASDGSALDGATGPQIVLDATIPNIQILSPGNVSVNGATIAFTASADVQLGGVGEFLSTGTQWRLVLQSNNDKAVTLKVDDVTTPRIQQFTDGAGTLSLKVPAPAAASDACVNGMWAEDDSFLYVCIGSNTWERVAIASW